MLLYFLIFIWLFLGYVGHSLFEGYLYHKYGVPLINLGEKYTATKYWLQHSWTILLGPFSLTAGFRPEHTWYRYPALWISVCPASGV